MTKITSKNEEQELSWEVINETVLWYSLVGKVLRTVMVAQLGNSVWSIILKVF